MSLSKIINGTVVTIDTFQFIYANYHYTASYVSRDKGAFTPHQMGWMVMRREIHKPNIPPCVEVLTENLWEGIIKGNRAPTILYATAEEVVDTTWLTKIMKTADDPIEDPASLARKGRNAELRRAMEDLAARVRVATEDPER